MRTVGLLLAWAFAAFAQNPPAEYADLYPSLQQKLTAFDATVNAQWDGSKPAVDFCAELLAANGNRGTQLLGINALTRRENGTAEPAGARCHVGVGGDHLSHQEIG